MRALFRLLVFQVLFFFPANAPAQEVLSLYSNIRTSAPTQVVEFNVDIGDSLLSLPYVQHQVFYRDSAVTSWNVMPMSLLYEACDTITASAKVDFSPPSGILEWYLRSEVDTVVVSQSPQNSSDEFPPPAYTWADMGSDSVGDEADADGEWLDIIHYYMTYSDSRLYARIDNRGGGFPTNSGLITYYAYGVGFIDPEKVDDSISFALAYASVPLIASPGLYRFDLRDSTYLRVGDITVDISGNSLTMSCSLADLAAQPEWTSWPPPCGFIYTEAATGTRILLSKISNDVSSTGAFISHTQFLQYTGNTAPTLESGNIALGEADTIVASVLYTDADGHLPVRRVLHLGEFEYDMTTCDKEYSGGSLFIRRFVTSADDWQPFFLEFSDGVISVTTSTDSIYLGPGSYVSGDADGSGIVNISDAVYLIAYIFGGGEPPNPSLAGDADCNGIVNISDAVYLIAYIFGGGNEPCAA